MNEVVYRAVPDFPGYRVGDDGSVWSRKAKGAHGAERDWWRMRTGANSHGYLMAWLCRSGKRTRFTVHALVMNVFVGPRPQEMEVRHLDGNKLNNHLANLRYGTRYENMDDRNRHGTSNRGERHPLAKLNWEVIASIRQRFDAGDRKRDIANEYGVTEQNITHIVNGRSWKAA